MLATKTIIESAWEQRTDISPDNATPELRVALFDTLNALDAGQLRLAEKTDEGWQVHDWLKKAILLSFRMEENRCSGQGPSRYYDKVPMKFEQYQEQDFAQANIRVTPGAHVRRGAYIAANVVLMPSYINIGAYIDTGCMIDTWATVGSCAQIGKNVHLSGGVGIGGVLEPLQASPTIIEDNCFIGARSEIVEGVIVEENSVLAMGVYLSQSTRIYDRSTGHITYGRIPAGSVVVPGSLPAQDGSHSLACAVIVKRVDARTRAKTSINELLRS